MRKFVRRRSSKVEVVQTVQIKNGDSLRVKTVAITSVKAFRQKETDIRKTMKNVVEQTVANQDSQQIISDIVFGNIPQKIFDEVKRISPVKRIEITKSTLIPGK